MREESWCAGLAWCWGLIELVRGVQCGLNNKPHHTTPLLFVSVHTQQRRITGVFVEFIKLSEHPTPKNQKFAFTASKRNIDTHTHPPHTSVRIFNVKPTNISHKDLNEVKLHCREQYQQGSRRRNNILNDSSTISRAKKDNGTRRDFREQ